MRTTYADAIGEADAGEYGVSVSDLSAILKAAAYVLDRQTADMRLDRKGPLPRSLMGSTKAHQIATALDTIIGAVLDWEEED